MPETRKPSCVACGYFQIGENENPECGREYVDSLDGRSRKIQGPDKTVLTVVREFYCRVHFYISREKKK